MLTPRAGLALALAFVLLLASQGPLGVRRARAAALPSEPHKLKICADKQAAGGEPAPDSKTTVDAAPRPTAPDELAKCRREASGGKKPALKSDPIAELMHEISRLKEELTPSDASVPSKAKKAEPHATSQPVGSQTVCDKSLAVATLGYRVLCHPKKVVISQRQVKQESQLTPTLLEASAADSELLTRERVDAFEPVEASELRRLQGLFEQLNKRGDFRPFANAV